METLKIMNYHKERADTGVKIEDIDSLYVIVLTGDELVRVIMKDGTQKAFDSAVLCDDSRAHDYFDGEYAVHKDDFAEWSERKDSYSWFGRMMKDATV